MAAAAAPGGATADAAPTPPWPSIRSDAAPGGGRSWARPAPSPGAGGGHRVKLVPEEPQWPQRSRSRSLAGKHSNVLRLSPVVEANTRRVLKRHRKPPRLNCTGTEWDPVDSELYNWEPQPEKYLLAVCLYGEQSNQQICMENYLLMAGLLNRTLVVSRHTFKREKRYDWDWEYFFDLDSAQRCFGNNTVISLREYKKRYPRPDDKAVINEIVCWKKKYCVELPETTKQDRPDIIWPKKATYEGFPGRSYIWTIMDVLPKFTGQMVTFGDIYGEYLHGASFAYNKPFGPIRRNCSLPFLPHSSITSAAEGFVKTFAVSFRQRAGSCSGQNGGAGTRGT
eukprot:SM000154S01377  [mRNA]  locus=s154:63240:66551:+ [translate_table: standard]